LLRRLADEARAAGRPVFEAGLAALATPCAFVAACRAILRQRPAVVVVDSAELSPRGRRLRLARPLPQLSFAAGNSLALHLCVSLARSTGPEAIAWAPNPDVVAPATISTRTPSQAARPPRPKGRPAPRRNHRDRKPETGISLNWFDPSHTRDPRSGQACPSTAPSAFPHSA
jgi:hypothetical protein